MDHSILEELIPKPLADFGDVKYFHKSSIELAKKLRAIALRCSNRDIEEVLSLSEAYCGFLFLNQLGVLADIKFEEAVADKVEKILSIKNSKKRAGVLHLTTSIYEFGGHSGVINRFLSEQSGSSLAVLGAASKTVRDQLPESIKIYQNLKKQSGIQTIKSILEIGEGYESIVIHLDSTDIYSAVAAILLRRKGVKIYAYNHADHVFGVGYAAADIVFEISKLGWINGERRGIANKQSFVGIPVESENMLNKLDNSRGERILITGDQEKFNPMAGYDIAKVLNRIFEDDIFKENYLITVCGTTGTKSHWKKLSAGIRSKINFTGRVEYKKFQELLSKTTLYIDSFPLANGSAFPQAVARGIPAFGLNLYAGYSCTDVLRSASIGELLKSLKQYARYPEVHLAKTMELRDQLVKEQSKEACMTRMNIAMNQKVKTNLPPSMSTIACNHLFFEERWQLNGEISIPFGLMKKLSLKSLMMLFIPLIKTVPYIKVNFLTLAKKYFNLDRLFENK